MDRCSKESDDEDIYGELDNNFSTGNTSIKNKSENSETCFTKKLIGILNETNQSSNSNNQQYNLNNTGDLDLYSELLCNDNKNKLEKEKKEKEHYKALEKENQELKREKTSLTEEVKLLTSENTLLKQNISSLYKTAKEQIDFQSGLIVELRADLDEYLFRRKDPRQENYSEYNDHRYNHDFHDTIYQSEEDNVFETNSRNAFHNSHSQPLELAERQIIGNSSLAVSNSKLNNITQVLEQAFDSFTQKQVDASRKLIDAVYYFKDQQNMLAERLKEATLIVMKDNNNLRSTKYSNRFNGKHPENVCSEISQQSNNEHISHKTNSSNNRKRKLSAEKFSNSSKRDVLKLYGYHNSDVPYVVRRRLGLPISKKPCNISNLNQINVAAKTTISPVPGKSISANLKIHTKKSSKILIKQESNSKNTISQPIPELNNNNIESPTIFQSGNISDDLRNTVPRCGVLNNISNLKNHVQLQQNTLTPIVGTHMNKSTAAKPIRELSSKSDSSAKHCTNDINPFKTLSLNENLNRSVRHTPLDRESLSSNKIANNEHIKCPLSLPVSIKLSDILNVDKLKTCSKAVFEEPTSCHELSTISTENTSMNESENSAKQYESNHKKHEFIIAKTNINSSQFNNGARSPSDDTSIKFMIDELVNYATKSTPLNAAVQENSAQNAIAQEVSDVDSTHSAVIKSTIAFDSDDNESTPDQCDSNLNKSVVNEEIVDKTSTLSNEVVLANDDFKAKSESSADFHNVLDFALQMLDESDDSSDDS